MRTEVWIRVRIRHEDQLDYQSGRTSAQMCSFHATPEKANSDRIVTSLWFVAADMPSTLAVESDVEPSRAPLSIHASIKSFSASPSCIKSGCLRMHASAVAIP